MIQFLSDICWEGCKIIGGSMLVVVVLLGLIFLAFLPVFLTTYSMWWLLLYVPAFGLIEWFDKTSREIY